MRGLVQKKQELQFGNYKIIYWNAKMNLKEKLLGISGGVSGSLSFLGGYQVCHNVCIGIISLLTLFGFSIAGMPLLFLTRVAIPFWMAAVMLLITMILLKYAKNLNISSKMLLLNSGLIIAGIPFQQLEQFNYIFWIVGGVLVSTSIVWHVYDKSKNVQVQNEN